MPIRSKVALAGLAAVLAAAAGGSAGAAGGNDGPDVQVNALLVGASAQNMLPFTVIPGVTQLDPHADAAASNPDGLRGGSWDTLEPEPGFSSAGQVTPSGVWGEQFTDDNGNGRYDFGEPFVDDPVNTRLDPSSAGRWDGVYMAGFGSDRVPAGAFDPIWARALYVRDPGTGLAYAQVSIDVLGWFSDWNDRIAALAAGIAAERAFALDVDHLIVSHTHNHESVDTHVGLWGPYPLGQPDLEAPVIDGTYPKYERYMEYKIAEAVVDAAQAAVPARVRFGSMGPGQEFRTLRGNTETLDDLQSRNSCRTPWVFDDELRVVQIAGDPANGAPNDGVIATLTNWGTHVESMEDGNVYVSSDFVHTIRSSVEEAFGGVAIHIPGAQGAAEVVGDSCLRRWQRTTLDGEDFPVAENGEPIVLRDVGLDPEGPKRRTYALGRVVGSAAVRAIEGAAWDPSAVAIDGFTSVTLDVPVNNLALSAIGTIGVIDKPSYIGGVSAGREAQRVTGTYTSPVTGPDTRTTLYAWRIGSAAFATAPGELFPELWWGLGAHNRTTPQTGSHYDYVTPNPAAIECASRPFSYGDPRGADTGRPFEPGIRQALLQKWGAQHNFLFGYTPDLLGYIVPGYDFAWQGASPVEGAGIAALHVWGAGEAEDPCRDTVPDVAFPGVRYGDHYHETNSASSMLAPAYACSFWRMLGLDPATSAEGGGACDEWDAWRNAGGLAHVGVEAPCNQLDDYECVRHY